MPRTVMVLQTGREPDAREVTAMLDTLIDKARELEVEPITVHVVAPKPDGDSLHLTVSPKP